MVGIIIYVFPADPKPRSRVKLKYTLQTCVCSHPQVEVVLSCYPLLEGSALKNRSGAYTTSTNEPGMTVFLLRAG